MKSGDAPHPQGDLILKAFPKDVLQKGFEFNAEFP